MLRHIPARTCPRRARKDRHNPTPGDTTEGEPADVSSQNSLNWHYSTSLDISTAYS